MQPTNIKAVGTFHGQSTFNPCRCRCPGADGTTVDPLRFGTLEAWHAIAWGANPDLYLHLFDFAPLAPFRGEGLRVRGFALRSDWVLGFASNALLCLEGLNKSLNRRFVADNSTPHPPGPLSPKRGEGEKIAGFSFDFKGVRILD